MIVAAAGEENEASEEKEGNEEGKGEDENEDPDKYDDDDEILKRAEEREAAEAVPRRFARFGLGRGGGGEGPSTGSGGDSGAPPPPPSPQSKDPNGDWNEESDGDDRQQQQQPPPRMSYRYRDFKRLISSPLISVPSLRKQAWNGCPPTYRADAWRILLGYLPSNASRRDMTLKRRRREYSEARRRHYDMDDESLRSVSEQETLRQVLVDVPRTAPDVPLFRDSRIRIALGRLLYVWACRHPASSYVQGINDLATPLLAVLIADRTREGILDDVLNGTATDELTDEEMDEVEADAYWCLTSLLAGIQDHYTADQPGVQRMVCRLEELVRRIDSDLAEHLRDTGVEFMQFAFRWMNCLLLREFNLPCIIRLWDAYLSEENISGAASAGASAAGAGAGTMGRGFEDFHVYVCAAFLCQFSAEVRSMEFDELFGFMQSVPTAEWGDGEVEILLSQA